jgi:hypothetical protein
MTEPASFLLYDLFRLLRKKSLAALGIIALLREGLYVDIPNSDKWRCEPWKEEAMIGLKNAAEQKG